MELHQTHVNGEPLTEIFRYENIKSFPQALTLDKVDLRVLQWALRRPLQRETDQGFDDAEQVGAGYHDLIGQVFHCAAHVWQGDDADPCGAGRLHATCCILNRDAVAWAQAKGFQGVIIDVGQRLWWQAVLVGYNQIKAGGPDAKCCGTYQIDGLQRGFGNQHCFHLPHPGLFQDIDDTLTGLQVGLVQQRLENLHLGCLDLGHIDELPLKRGKAFQPRAIARQPPHGLKGRSVPMPAQTMALKGQVKGLAFDFGCIGQGLK